MTVDEDLLRSVSHQVRSLPLVPAQQVIAGGITSLKALGAIDVRSSSGWGASTVLGKPDGNTMTITVKDLGLVSLGLISGYPQD